MSFNSLNSKSSESDDVKLLLNKIQELADQVSKLTDKLDNLSSRVDKIDRNLRVSSEYYMKREINTTPSLADNMKEISRKVDEMYQKSRPRDTSKVMIAGSY